jgi:hypothetical protein
MSKRNLKKEDEESVNQAEVFFVAKSPCGFVEFY